MSSPQKPWEDARLQELGIGRTTLNSHAPPNLTNPAAPGLTRLSGTLPPLPPRPPQMISTACDRHTYNTFPQMFHMPGSYGGYTGFGGYGGYHATMAGYGGYGYGGSYGFPGSSFENRFLQVAEESSRDAFQSIESLVRAFTSVSMMLESTYHAMYTSFRAVLGVVDNFSRLRQLFTQFLSAITILRVIRHCYRRLLYWLGVLDCNPQTDQIWNTVAEDKNPQVMKYSKWPLITFIAFLFGGPYLISKFFSSSSDIPYQKWDVNKGKYMKAPYPHQAGSAAELSFNANEILNLAPQEMQPYEASGWLLAINRRGQVGYIPITRLGVTRIQWGKAPQQVTPTGPHSSVEDDTLSSQ